MNYVLTDTCVVSFKMNSIDIGRKEILKAITFHDNMAKTWDSLSQAERDAIIIRIDFILLKMVLHKVKEYIPNSDN